MPKQIFQRPVPVRHDHWSKPKQGGAPVPQAKKRKAPKPADTPLPPGIPPIGNDTGTDKPNG